MNKEFLLSLMEENDIDTLKNILVNELIKPTNGLFDSSFDENPDDIIYNNQIEQWRDYGKKYHISNFGRVKYFNTQYIIPQINKNKNLYLDRLKWEEKCKNFYIPTYKISNDTIIYYEYIKTLWLDELKENETISENKQVLNVDITDKSNPANGGFNYASTSGTEAIATRTEILGKLEKYAVESHLTGITLFENGGYVKYSSRLDIPTDEYITGFGFGILSEGDITDDLPGATEKYKRYYHSAQSSNPGKINAMDDTGSQVSDLSGYITSTYWGTKMNNTKNGYDWYPILAKDTVDGKPNKAQQIIVQKAQMQAQD